jgi:hypothetical protein
MGTVTHQTVKLSRGKHSSPEEGACVMELASMLSGEPFTDHPASVSPVIASLLRAYNDAVGDRRRQELLRYAARVVGSRGSADVERARAARLRAGLPERRRGRLSRLFVPACLMSLAPNPSLDLTGARIVSRIKASDARAHAEVLALVDELLALGGPRSTDTGPFSERQARGRRLVGSDI